MRKKKNEKGVVLIFSCFVLAIMLTLTSATLSRSISERVISEQYTESRDAFWVAEAGAQVAQRALTSGNWTNWTNVTSTESNCIANLSGGSYNVSVFNASGTSPQIVCTASVGGITRALNITMQRQTSSRFRYAAFGVDGVNVTGQGFVNSYNSSLGAYGGSNNFTNGDIGTNSGAQPAIFVGGQGKVYGDAGTGANGTVNITGQGNVSGTTSDDISETMSLPTIPGNLSNLTSSGAYIRTTSDTISTGSYKYSEFTISSKANITISGTVEIYLTNVTNTTLTTSGQSKIYIPSGSSLTIYTDGGVSLTGQGILNVDSDPADLQIYSTYSSSTDGVNLAGQANLFGAIYAPGAVINFAGQADVFGALVGRRVNMSGQGDLHYDESLASLQAAGSGGVSLQSWREQQNPYPLQL